jgi:excisionase family DNA binding protein
VKLNYSVSEACEALGIGRTTLYFLIKQRELEVCRIGRRTLVPVRSIERFVTERSTSPGPKGRGK